MDCLLEDPEFDCRNTGQLKMLSGIWDQRVMFVQDQTHFLPIPPKPTGSTDPNPSLQEEQETREDCLERELAVYKDFVKTYNEVIDGLPEKRSKLVEGLAIIDTLLTVRDSIRENTSHTSIACTTKPDKIEREWNEHVCENPVTREW